MTHLSETFYTLGACDTCGEHRWVTHDELDTLNSKFSFLTFVSDTALDLCEHTSSDPWPRITTLKGGD